PKPPANPGAASASSPWRRRDVRHRALRQSQGRLGAKSPPADSTSPPPLSTCPNHSPRRRREHRREEQPRIHARSRPQLGGEGGTAPCPRRTARRIPPRGRPRTRLHGDDHRAKPEECRAPPTQPPHHRHL